MMYRLDVPTKRGVILNGVLFRDTANRIDEKSAKCRGKM